MNLTITEVLDNIKAVADRIYNSNGYEFKRGFETCYVFFEQQMKKTTLCHQSLLIEQIRELEKENEKLRQVAKISFAKEIAKSNEEFKYSESELSKLTKKNNSQKAQIERQVGVITAQKYEIFRLKNELEHAKKLATTKYHRLAIKFIDYLSLKEQFKEYVKSGESDYYNANEYLDNFLNE